MHSAHLLVTTIKMFVFFIQANKRHLTITKHTTFVF